MSAKSQHNNILYAILGFAAAVAIVALIGFFALGRDPELIQGQVEVYKIIEQVQVCTNLIVPRLLGFIADRFFYLIVVLWSILHIVVSLHGILLMSIQVGLQDIAEHLDVITSSAIAL